MMKHGVLFILLALFFTCGANGSNATNAPFEAPAYPFTGKVTEVDESSISLSNGKQSLRFEKSRRDIPYSELNDAKRGDRFRIWYQLSPVKVIKVPESDSRHELRQQPGEVAPENPPREKKQIILDDRAFYDASRDAEDIEWSKTMT